MKTQIFIGMIVMSFWSCSKSKIETINYKCVKVYNFYAQGINPTTIIDSDFRIKVEFNYENNPTKIKIIDSLEEADQIELKDNESFQAFNSNYPQLNLGGRLSANRDTFIYHKAVHISVGSNYNNTCNCLKN